MDKYKEQDSKVLSDLDESIGSDYSGDYKDRYKSLMINQYKNLTYEITEEMIFKNIKENKGEEIDRDDEYKKIHANCCALGLKRKRTKKGKYFLKKGCK